jgi:hypothetical protein
MGEASNAESSATAVKNQVGSVATTAKDQASSVARDAKDQVQRLAGDARTQLQQQAGERSHQLAQTLRELGGQLDGMASGKSAPSGLVADLTQQAASSVQRMAQTLDRKGPDGVIADVKRFARERPAVFVVGALGAGMIAGRLFRALDTSAVAQAAKPSQDSDEVAPQHVAGAELPGPAALNRPKEF